ncbi:MAG: hypothetical protein ACPGSE_00295 [Synechococcus sp.]
MAYHNRIEVLNVANCMGLYPDTEEGSIAQQEMREWIKCQVHEWPKDLIVETLCDAVEGACMKERDEAAKLLRHMALYVESGQLARESVQPIDDEDEDE